MSDNVRFVAIVNGASTGFDPHAWRDRDQDALLTAVLLPPLLIGVPNECQEEAAALADKLALLTASELAALRTMVAVNVALEGADPAHPASYTVEAQRRLALRFDEEGPIPVAWRALQQAYDQPWRVAGDAHPADATMVVVPTWHYGMRATAVDASPLDVRLLVVLLSALIAEGDHETLIALVDQTQVQRILGTPGDSGAAAPLAAQSKGGSRLPRWVTTPFGWVRLPITQAD